MKTYECTVISPDGKWCRIHREFKNRIWAYNILEAEGYRIVYLREIED